MRSRSSTTVVALLLSGILCLGSTAACGQSPKGSAVVLATKDRTTWALPLDVYRGPNFAHERYAIQLASVDCMTARGLVDVPVLEYNPNAPPDATFNDAGRRLFDLAVAETFGYSLDKPHRWDSEKAWEIQRSLSGTAADTYIECEEQARDRLGIGKSEDYAAGIAVSISPEEDPSVVEATARWRDCMAPLGIADMPGVPYGMPPTSLTDEWWVWSEATSLEYEPLFKPPTAHEIEFAVFDANCRESSGWAQAYYDAEWDLQEAYVLKHFDQLETVRTQNAERTAILDQVIAQNGG